MGKRPKQNYAAAIEKYHKGASVANLAKDCGITRQGMIAVLARHGITDRHDHDCRIRINVNEAVNLYNQGMRVKDLSKKYHCTPAAICIMLRKCGVEPREKYHASESPLFPVIERALPESTRPELRPSFKTFQKDYAEEILRENPNEWDSLVDEWNDETDLLLENYMEFELDY